MNNILIVDDEPIIREGMKEALDELGYFNVFSAENGMQALEIIQVQDISAMILDISMPDMNGIELMTELNRKGIKPITVIVSGYNEFDYAKEALNYGAVDYILKPIDSEDVMGIGVKLKELLEAKEHDRQRVEKLRKLVHESKDTIKQKVLYEIINNEISEERLKEISDFFELNLNGEFFCAVVIRIEKKDIPIEEVDFQVRLKIIEESIAASIGGDTNINLFNMENAKYVLLFNACEPFGKSYIQDILTRIAAKLESVSDVACYMGKGDEVKDRANIASSYHNAQEALDYKSMFGAGFIYDIGDYRQDGNVLLMERMLGELETYIRLMQYDSSREKVEELFEYMLKNQDVINRAQIRFYSMKCMMLFSTILLENGHEASRLFSEGVFNPLRLLGNDSIQAERKRVVKMFNRTAEQMANGYLAKHKRIAELLKQHIDVNYMDSELSVASLSRTFNYSPNYIGSVFKKKYSVSINDYLNRYRIEQAKKLLDETDLKIYEIAFEVGFKDQHYFSKQFKRHINITPKEYKESE